MEPLGKYNLEPFCNYKMEDDFLFQGDSLELIGLLLGHKRNVERCDFHTKKRSPFSSFYLEETFVAPPLPW